MARKDNRPKEEASTIAGERQHQGKPVPVSRNILRSPAFLSIYANDVQIHTSPWDLRIILGEIVDAAGGDSPSIQVNQLGEVRVSPQLAKKLVQAISEQLQAYEHTFGHIPDIGGG